MTSPAQSQKLARIAPAFAVLLFLYYAVVILLHPAPPMLGDFSRWIYLGELLARRMHGQPDPSHFLFHYPVPNSTHTVMLGLLSAVMSWAAAARVYLILTFAIFLFAIRSLARAAGTSPLIWFIAPGAFFLSVNFWYGFLAFQLGVAVLFFFTAALLRRADAPPGARWKDWPIGGLLVALFFTHMVPLTFALLLLFFFVRQTGHTRLLWQAALPVLLTAWYVAGRIVTGPLIGSVITTSQPQVFNVSFWVYKANTFAKSFGLVNPASDSHHSIALVVEGAPLFLILFAVNLAVCVSLAIVFVCNARPGSPLRNVQFVWLATAIALPVYLVTPRDLLAISDPGSRILQTVLWLALFFCLRQNAASSIPARIAAGGSVLLALAGLVLFTVLPWSSYPPSAKMLPGSLESLANAPYGYAGLSLRHLQDHRYQFTVFPTSLMGNRYDTPGDASE